MADQNSIYNSLLFYSFLKKIIATDSKLTATQSTHIWDKLESCNSVQNLQTLLATNMQKNQLDKYLSLIHVFNSYSFVVDSFKYAMCFIKFKDYILNKVKKEKEILDNLDIFQKIKDKKNPSYKLTCAYDIVSALYPYKNRVYAIWILNNNFYEFLQKLSISKEFLQKLLISKKFINYFQIQLDESIKQSGFSNSGANYENRIAELFKYYNLSFISHYHEIDDRSQEHDFVMKYNNHSIGVGVKRTLRERYKQYKPTKKEFKYSLIFTIGEDLTESKSKIITHKYMSDIFVADEIYNIKHYMQENIKIHKVTSFSPALLSKIIKNGGFYEN